jgi:glycosyl hydrolase family 123
MIRHIYRRTLLEPHTLCFPENTRRIMTIVGLILLGWQAPASMSLAYNGTENRFWGRESFTPDWREAELIDDRASQRFLSAYWPGLKQGYDTGGAPGSAESGGEPGLSTFITPTTKVILPGYIPTADEAQYEQINLFAARGESEAFSLGIRNLSGVRPVSIEVTDLVNDNVTLPAEIVTNRLVLAYPANMLAGNGQYRPAIRPMVLLKPPENQWAFPPYTTHNYFVDVHVPDDAKAGFYTGQVLVKSSGKLTKSIDLKLEVLPFKLKTNGFHAGAYGTTWDIWEGGFFGYYPEMIEMDSRYGFNMAGGFFNKDGEIPFKRRKSGELVVDVQHPKFWKFNTTMQTLKSHGMGDVAFWNWGASGKVRQFNDVLEKAGVPGIDTEAGKLGFAEMCRAIKLAEKSFNWPELVINPYDEALKDQNATREIIESIPYVRRLSPETRLYMTEWREHYTRLYQSSGKTLNGSQRPRWSEYIRLLASFERPRKNFDVIGSNRLSDDSRDLQDDLGGEYWHYTGVTRMGPQVRYAYGFAPHIVDAEAAMVWANYKGTLDGRGWTLHYVMPDMADGRKRRDTRGPVISSPRAIAVREGIDDRKYIETLKYYAQETNSEKDIQFLKRLQERSREIARTDNIGGIENREAIVTQSEVFQLLREELKYRILSLINEETE